MLGHTYVHLLAPACTRLHLLAPAHTFRTRAGVRTCEFSHIRTFTHISKNFFAKQNSGSHTMHVAHILHACGCADVRNFAHPHFHTHIQNFFCKKKLWQPHHAHCTHFASVRVCGRAKFRTSALSHTFPKIFLQKLRLGAQSVTLLSTLRDPTQLRRRQCATRQGQVILFIHD